MNPDELRELLIPNTAITSDEARRRIAAAADEIDTLRKRLEAAEEALDLIANDHETQAYFAAKRDWHGLFNKSQDIAKIALAALAGEETWTRRR